MNLTFLLPGDGYSGGVRVTMQMGNCLLERGYTVRIAYPRSPAFSKKRLTSIVRSAKYLCSGVTETRWLSNFKGRTETYLNLNDLEFKDDEVVIATGIHTIEALQNLQRNVRKIRYCHGLLENEPEASRRLDLWRGGMDTIAVSPVLVQPLKKLCEGRILGVVLNGISPKEYFVENVERDGIGFIYSGEPVKGPEVATALTKALREHLPAIPLHVFGSYPKPTVLAPSEYKRYPSIPEARALYNRCKIWVVTSRDEGFCLPILEAMACGCVVISSKHTNAAELIRDGVNGFTVLYGDVEAYLGLIKRLLNDQVLHRRIVAEGLGTAKQYAWENAADQMEEALRNSTTAVVQARAV